MRKANGGSGWQFNGVPLNVQTGLLAVILLAGTMGLAQVGYWLLSARATDMTQPATAAAVGSPYEDSSPHHPDDLPD